MTVQAPILAATRHDGWTAARRTQFLDHLANDGSVQAACARVGMSREAAYRLRRREPLFARSWDAAQVLARAAGAEVLASRAIDGVEEDVWYKGELVGTRRKYDSRLLLAHMARLDRLAEDERAREDAARFDEMLALVGGAAVPEDLMREPGELPPGRENAVERAGITAEREALWAAEDAARTTPSEEDGGDEDDDLDEEDAELAAWEIVEAEIVEAGRAAAAAAAARWDGWFSDACETVDRLLDEPFVANPANVGTLSTLSTSPFSAAATPRDAGSGNAPTKATWADYYAGRGPLPQD